jgi:hypothetical protein
MSASTKIYNMMLEENDQKLLIDRIKEAYQYFQACVNEIYSQETESAYFDKEFEKAR